jgi:hypothetical protein
MGRGKSNKPTKDFVKEQLKDFEDFIKSYSESDGFSTSKIYSLFIEKANEPSSNYYDDNYYDEYSWWSKKRSIIEGFYNDINDVDGRVLVSTWNIMDVFWDAPKAISYRSQNFSIPYDEKILQILAYLQEEIKEETYFKSSIKMVIQRSGDHRQFHYLHSAIPYRVNCNIHCAKLSGYIRKLQSYAAIRSDYLHSCFNGEYLENLNKNIKAGNFSTKLSLFEEINQTKKSIERSLEEFIDIMNIDFDSSIDYYEINGNLSVVELQKLCKVGLKTNEAIE